MTTARTYILGATLVLSCWFQYGQDRTTSQLAQYTIDIFDRRPAKRILIIGNSRTGYNDMPTMLRHIADSARSAQKYQIVSLTPDGASFETLMNNYRVRRLSVEHWDEIAIQGRSGGQLNHINSEEFLKSGRSIIGMLKNGTPQPRVIVNWAYDTSKYESSPGYSPEEARAYHYNIIQTSHKSLAESAGASIINVGRLWEVIRVDFPQIPLTVDGNHPTIFSSYFLALCLYAKISGKSVDEVSWAPPQISNSDAKKLREVVDENTSLL